MPVSDLSVSPWIINSTGVDTSIVTLKSPEIRIGTDGLGMYEIPIADLSFWFDHRDYVVQGSALLDYWPSRVNGIIAYQGLSGATRKPVVSSAGIRLGNDTSTDGNPATPLIFDPLGKTIFDDRLTFFYKVKAMRNLATDTILFGPLVPTGDPGRFPYIARYTSTSYMRVKVGDGGSSSQVSTPDFLDETSTYTFICEVIPSGSNLVYTLSEVNAGVLCTLTIAKSSTANLSYKVFIGCESHFWASGNFTIKAFGSYPRTLAASEKTRLLNYLGTL